MARLGKDRVWLAEVTPYKANSIRQALAPNGGARSHRMQEVLSRAIEDEEARQRAAVDASARPGIFEIFLTDEQLDRADRASRVVRAPSLVSFCRDAILAKANEIIRDTKFPTPRG